MVRDRRNNPGSLRGGSLLNDLDHDSTIFAVYKLLVTSPGACRYYHNCVRPEDRLSLSSEVAEHDGSPLSIRQLTCGQNNRKRTRLTHHIEIISIRGMEKGDNVHLVTIMSRKTHRESALEIGPCTLAATSYCPISIRHSITCASLYSLVLSNGLLPHAGRGRASAS